MPPREIGADRDVADQLPVHRLREEPVELLDIFLVGAPVRRLGEVESPSSVDRGARPLPTCRSSVAAGRQQLDAVEQRAVGEEVLERQIFRKRLGDRSRAVQSGCVEERLHLRAEQEACGPPARSRAA